MNLAKHDAETEMEMNMTPMIDVVFLLIIFFMIITDMTQQDLEELQLPVAQFAQPDRPDPDEWRPVLNIPQDGRMIVKKNALYDPERDDAKPDPYKEVKLWLADVARRMDKEHLNTPLPAEGLCTCGQITNPHPPGRGDAIPGEALLIRADEGTTFRHIQKVMEFCGETGIRIWKVQLAAAEPKSKDEEN